MIISNEKGYLELTADEGKLLKLGNKVFKGGSFPKDFDYSEIEEFNEVSE